jgi:radical SAM protein with 4Fe4S-binding SPASM domain
MRSEYDAAMVERFREGIGVRHPLFGDLLRPDGVRLDGALMAPESYEERSPYFVHLSVTGRCNARCEGCINSTLTDPRDFAGIPETEPERDTRAILQLLDGRPERDVIVCFYGGEPLLRMDKVHAVMDLLDRSDSDLKFRYMIYTNGMLLDRAIAKYPEMVRRTWLFSVSIDGGPEQHNRVRPGTDLATVHRNLRLLKEFGRDQALVWSTLRESQSLDDCIEEFLRLEESGLADHFFWHWVETDAPFRALEGFMRDYERGLRRAMEIYVERAQEGRIFPAAHLNELLLYILTGRERGGSGCGVERARNFDIAGGTVHSCADLPPELAIGHIEPDGTPVVREADLAGLLAYKDGLGCRECGVHAYCGGRCPVQALTGDALRLVQYCQLMRLHVGVVQEYTPRVVEAMKRSGLTVTDLYDRSAYFVQYTDVTP